MRTFLRRVALAVALLSLSTSFASAAPAAKEAVPQSSEEVHLTFAPVVRKVAPAVVNVYSRSVVQAQVSPLFSNPFFRQFFGASPEFQRRVQQSLGSGIVVRADGLILTNNHVISGGQDIVVALADKREFKAKVVSADARSDLALLKIDTHGEKLPTIPFGDSDKLQVGDLVLAIGDPFGVGQTVTMGIVSALARTGVSANDYQFFIQTDAAINPGNSGGALVTTDGKLVGINSNIVSRTGESVGIGFAIPANLARRFVEGGANGGTVRQPWIGADGQTVTADLASGLGLSRPGGVVLKSVFSGGPAAKAGLKTGDVILSADGFAVEDMQSLNYRVATHKPGDVLKIQVSRGGKQRDTSLTLALPPENPPRELTTISGQNPLAGAKVENLSPAVSSDFNLDAMTKGVVVVSTASGTPAGGYGFQAGDIVASINGTAIAHVSDLQHALGSANGHWDMVVNRGGSHLRLSVSQ